MRSARVDIEDQGIRESGENRLPISEDVVEGIGEETSGLRQLPPDLLDVLLPAFTDLLLEEKLEGAVAESVAALGGVVHHDVAHQGTSQAASPGRRIL
jgi:hypothetical protein